MEIGDKVRIILFRDENYGSIIKKTVCPITFADVFTIKMSTGFYIGKQLTYYAHHLEKIKSKKLKQFSAWK